ncbi:MAG: transposase [Verrucomicrobiales bacterium]
MNVLSTLWRDEANAWLVGDYLLMPDHLHLFCVPRQSVDQLTNIEAWIKFWKARATKKLELGGGIWQRGAFHHRLRSLAEHEEKWEYVRQNPVRAGLVISPELWPFRSSRVDRVLVREARSNGPAKRIPTAS